MLLSEVSRRLTPLYRGLRLPANVTVNEVVHLPIRRDRAPLTTGIVQSAVFSYGIELTLGIKDIRKTCMYATTSLSEAKRYGASVVEVIIDPATVIVYNPRRSDSYTITAAGEESNSRSLGNHVDKLVYKVAKEWEKANPGKMPYDFMDDHLEEDSYLGKPAKQMLHDFIAAATSDVAVQTKLKQELDVIARKMVAGYKAIPYSQLPPSVAMDGVEISITGIDSASGKVVLHH